MDISNPSYPVLENRYTLPCRPLSSFVSGPNVFIADWYSLMIYSYGSFCTGIPGDSNSDGVFNGLDLVYDINYFKGHGDRPSCFIECPPHGGIYKETDANGSCKFSGFDVMYSVNYLKALVVLLISALIARREGSTFKAKCSPLRAE